MFTQELQSKIDQVWLAFHSGGLSNPLSVIEQITFLLFIKQLDELQNRAEQQAIITGNTSNYIYTDENQDLRWSNFKNVSPEEMYKLFQKENGVFDFMKNFGGKSTAFSKFMKNANFMIPTARLLAQVVEMLDKVDMDDKDTKGDVYEYMLGKIASAGSNGQFRTPRHIIKMMVEYLQENYKEDLLKPEVQKHYLNEMFTGMEFDPTMIRIGAMNLILHGIENPQLKDVDSLSQANADFEEKVSLILANPPFKGSLDKDAVDEKVIALVDSKKTELLFLGLMLKGLKVGGRCAVIIPDGVLFGSSTAHKKIRKEIVENQALEAVISMPSGVFKPYAGVSTAILVFTKTNAGGTENVWFYDMKADGYSLDDKRAPVKENDIPDIITRFHTRENEVDRARTEQSFCVPKEEIAKNAYDLSINKYKEVIYEQKVYAKPADIIASIQQLDKERNDLMVELLNLK